MSICVFLILDFILASIIVWFIMSNQLPDGRFALKRFENWLWDINHHNELKKTDKFEFTYKNKLFSIRIEENKPVDNFSYQKIEYKNVYINEELVCRLWLISRTVSTYRWVETSTTRHSSEIFDIIKYAKKKVNQIWSDDCNAKYEKESDNKSYFTKKDIDN